MSTDDLGHKDCSVCDAAREGEASGPEPTTEERMRGYFGSRAAYASGDNDPVKFLCREIDDIRRQLESATERLATLGPPPTGAHAHVMVSTWDWRKWICAECLEEGTRPDPPTCPTYEELVAKKRERSGG